MLKVKFFCWLMFSNIILFSQEKGKENVIYVKGGSVIRGEILDSTDAGVTIKPHYENIWFLNQSIIDSILLEEVSIKNVFLQKKSHLVIADLGVLSGNRNNEREHPFSLHVVNAYPFTRSVSAGVGIGVEFYNETIIPVFMDGRFFFNTRNKGSIPFVYAKVGYSFSLEDKEGEFGDNFNSKGGFLSGIGLGCMFAINEMDGIFISIGYRFQQLEHLLTNDWNNMQINRFEKFNRLAIKVGLQID